VVAAFTALLAIGGWTNYSLPVYLQHLTEERGLPLAAISGGTSIVFIAGSLATPLTGWIVNRRDPRGVIVVGGVLGGVSVAAIGQVTEVWQAYIAYVGMGLAFIACAGGPATVAVLRHADPAARATPIAMATMGMSMGGVLISPLTALAIDTLGFSRATPLLGLGLVVVVLVSVVFVMPRSAPDVVEAAARDRAAAARLVDEELEQADAEVALQEAHEEPGADVSYAEAKRTWALWVLVAAIALMLGGHISAITHLVRLGTERGVGIASLLVSVLTIGAVAARFIGGPMLRLVPLWPWSVFTFGLQSAAIMGLAFADNAVTMVLCCLLLGLAVGSAPIVFTLTMVETFGIRDYARLSALQNLFSCIGPGFGPVLLSVVHDSFGGYKSGYLVMSAVSWVSTALMYVAGRLARALVARRRAVAAAAAAAGS
jgi:MFS family permease